MLRNCHFLRKWELKARLTSIPSAMPKPMSPTSNVPLMHPDTPTFSSNDACVAIGHPTEGTYTSTCLWSSKIPRALSGLFSDN